MQNAYKIHASCSTLVILRKKKIEDGNRTVGQSVLSWEKSVYHLSNWESFICLFDQTWRHWAYFNIL